MYNLLCRDHKSNYQLIMIKDKYGLLDLIMFQ